MVYLELLVPAKLLVKAFVFINLNCIVMISIVQSNSTELYHLRLK